MIIVLVTVTMIVIIRVRNIMRIPAIVIVIIIIIDIIFFLLSVLSEPHRVIYVTTDFIFIDFTRSRDLCKSSFHFRDRDVTLRPKYLKISFVAHIAGMTLIYHCCSLFQILMVATRRGREGSGGGVGGGTENAKIVPIRHI